MAWAPDYPSTEQVRRRLGIESDERDADIALVKAAASRAVDRFAGRQFGKVDAVETRYYTARWDRHRNAPRWVVPIDDLMTTVDLTITCTGGTITDYVLEPRNAAAKGRPWELLVVNASSAVQPTGLEDDIALTGWPGWTSVPEAIVLASLIQAHRFFHRENSPYGIAGSPDQGSEMRLLERLDPDVATSIGAYRRMWAVR